MSRLRPGFLTRHAADQLNDALDRVGGLEISGLGADSTRVVGPDSQFLNVPDRRDWWFAELTDSGTGSPPVFSWREVVEAAGGVWAASERSGVSNAYRVARAGASSGPAAAGDLVVMRESTRISGLCEFYVASSATASGTGSAGTSTGPVVGFLDTDVQCLDGVLWVVKRPMYQAANGTVTFGAAFYSHTAGCCTCPASSGSGTSPPPPPPPSGGTGGTVVCCGRALSDTLYATLGGGYGTITLTWDGSAYWVGSGRLSCGQVLWLRFTLGCGLQFSCDGTNWASTFAIGTSVSCGPPFSMTGTFGCNMGSALAGCAGGACGTVNVVSVSE